MVLWFKALHILSAFFWVAGLMYLPRLFVYHTETTADDEIGRARFVVMETRLYWRIMMPAMLSTLLFGILLLPHYRGGWVALKLLLVLMLVIFHVYCGWITHRFRGGYLSHSSRFFRIFNEIPALLIIGIVLLVVLKPY